MTTKKKTDAQQAFENVRKELAGLRDAGSDTRLLEVTLEELSKVIYSQSWARLRERFPDSMIGKLPRVTCKPCRDTRTGSCPNHQRRWCDGCKNTISSAHIHLDYVGHAAVTDRLNEVDPTWTWSFGSVDEHGQPLFDRNGGLWIYLTVLGITRPAYGDAEGKSGADAVKAAISDGIKNGAMRFGVGLDLWSKEDLHAADEPPAEVPPAPEPEKPKRRQVTKATVDWLSLPPSISDLEVLMEKGRECHTAGEWNGAVQAAFLKRKNELEAKAAEAEAAAVALLKDELGATAVE